MLSSGIHLDVQRIEMRIGGSAQQRVVGRRLFIAAPRSARRGETRTLERNKWLAARIANRAATVQRQSEGGYREALEGNCATCLGCRRCIFLRRVVATLLRIRTTTGRVTKPDRSRDRLAAGRYYLRAGTLIVVCALSDQGAAAHHRRILVLPVRGNRFLRLPCCRCGFSIRRRKPGPRNSITQADIASGGGWQMIAFLSPGTVRSNSALLADAAHA